MKPRNKIEFDKAGECLCAELPNGNAIIVGPGEEHRWGGYVRVVDGDDEEIGYWDKAEWAGDPECVMGAIFACALGKDKVN